MGGSHSCQDSLLFTVGEYMTKPLKVFNKRLDKSRPVTILSAAVIWINSQVTVFPLHASLVILAMTNPRVQSTVPNEGLLPVVPASLWIRQYMGTMSMRQYSLGYLSTDT